MSRVAPAQALPSPRTALAACAALAAAGVLAAAARAGDPPGRQGLDERSLPLRTALHHDPTMQPPFEKLLAMYREAGRVDELVRMYKSHLAQFPADAGAASVLVRVLSATGDPEAASFARRSADMHPRDAFLRYLLYRTLRAKNDARSLDELDGAIALEESPSRKRAWIEELLPEAVIEDRKGLAERHLRGLVELAGDTPEGLLAVGRKMLELDYHALALEALERAAGSGPAPEAMVEIEMAAASAEVGLDRMEEAAGRLDRLLAKLTADYWRRPEIVRRRASLVRTEAERRAMIDDARARLERDPHDEAAVLDLARVLEGFELRRDALEVLLEGGGRLPDSTPIEKATHSLLDRLRDERGREAYLAARLARDPGRADLALAHVRTLYLLGRRNEAREELDALLEGLDGGARANRLLETARYLRRASLPADAAALLDKVAELAPERLDVRRELAETLLVTGDRRRCEALLGRGVPEGTTTENLVDVVQFMLKHEFCAEARGALRVGVRRNETNLELRTLLFKVESRLGNRDAGEGAVSEARDLADTPARYRLWLEGAAEFHEAVDTLDAFLDDERERLEFEGGELEAGRLERVLVFADVAARGGRWSAWDAESDRKARVAVFLRRLLQAGPSPETCVKLRRRLVAVLADESDQRQVIERQLKELVREDEKFADEHNARLALLYWDADRADLAAPILEGLDVARVSDAELLGRLEQVYEKLASSGRARGKVIQVLERRTALDPTNRGVWERWLEANARSGDELVLRAALRRLLAGVERMPLSDDTRARMVGHLTDSYWRSIAALVAGGKESALADALALVDAAERVASTRNQWLWANWTRGYVLNRLGRDDARDEALDEIERVAREAPVAPPLEKPDAPGARSADAGAAAAPGGRSGKDDKEEPDPDRPAVMADGVAFPDGLSVSLARARAVLTGETGPDDALVPLDREGPLTRLEVRWAFDAPGGASVVRIVPLAWPRLLVCDETGTISCLHKATGKLLWERASAVPPTPAAGNSPYLRYGNTHVLNPPVPPGLAPDWRGRIFVGGTGEVTCLSVRDGSDLWRVPVGGAGVAGGATRVSVFEYGGAVLACAPASGSVACLDPETGKLLWETALGRAPGSPPAGSLGSGASLSAGRVFVYGPRAAVLDASTGEVEWSFEPERVRAFPLKLEGPDAPGASMTVAPVMSPFGMGRFGGYSSARMWTHSQYGQVLFGGGYGYGAPVMAQPQPSYVVHLSRPSPGTRAQGTVGTVYAAPAVVWAANTGQERLGILVGERLLLVDRGNVQVLRLDLPLAGKSSSAPGTFVGMAGRVACFLNQSALQLVDVVAGESHAVALQDVLGRPEGQVQRQTQAARLQAAVDGPLVYVTGPGGVMCVNARVRRKVLAAAWPGGAVPKEEPSALAGATTPAPQPWASPHAYRMAMHRAGIQQTSIQYHRMGTCTNRGGVQGACIPMVDRAEDGVLYATPTPSRVVAIAEERAVPPPGAEEDEW